MFAKEGTLGLLPCQLVPLWFWNWDVGNHNNDDSDDDDDDDDDDDGDDGDDDADDDNDL